MVFIIGFFLQVFSSDLLDAWFGRDPHASFYKGADLGASSSHQCSLYPIGEPVSLVDLAYVDIQHRLRLQPVHASVFHQTGSITATLL